jgi:hypothetical protein
MFVPSKQNQVVILTESEAHRGASQADGADPRHQRRLPTFSDWALCGVGQASPWGTGSRLLRAFGPESSLGLSGTASSGVVMALGCCSWNLPANCIHPVPQASPAGLQPTGGGVHVPKLSHPGSADRGECRLITAAES